jgi:hypothetical protein
MSIQPVLFAPAARPETQPVDLVRLGASAFVTIQFLYVLSFNFVPGAVATVLAASIALIHMLLAIYAIMIRPAAWNLMILGSMAITIMCWMVSHGFGTAEVSLSFPFAEAFRDFAIFFAAIWLMAFPERLPHKWLMYLVVAGTILGSLIALTGPPNIIAGTVRLASITGGEDGIHPGAKFMAVQLILVDLFRRLGMLPRYVAWALIALTLFILEGLGGRNEMLLVFVYAAGVMYYKFPPSGFIKSLPFLGFVLFCLLAFVAFSVGENIEDWGSGRIGVWLHRYEIIQHRDLATFLFGGGLGADRLWTPQWRWMATALAHNDFVHLLMERGLIGLMATFLMLAGLAMRLHHNARALLVAVIASSALSNGFLQTPMAASHAMLALSLALFVYQRQQAIAAEEEAEEGHETNWQKNYIR